MKCAIALVLTMMLGACEPRGAVEETPSQDAVTEAPAPASAKQEAKQTTPIDTAEEHLLAEPPVDSKQVVQAMRTSTR